MSDEKISQLSDAGAITGGESIEVVRGLNNLRTTLGAARGVASGKSMPSIAPYTPTITNPTAMTWALQRMYRPNQPFSPRLQTFLHEMTQDMGYYNRNGNVGTYSYANGVLSIASTAATSGNDHNLFGYETFEIPAFTVAVEQIVPTTDTGFNAIDVGIAKNQSVNNALFCYFEVGSGSQNRVTIGKIVGGSFTTLAQTAANSLPANMTGVAYSINGNNATAWIQVNGKSWVPVLSAGITDFNLLNPTELAQWHPWIVATGGITVPWKIGAIRTGYCSGPSGFRDFKVVTNKDGTPYVSGGHLYFTTSRGLEAVWRLNPKNGVFEETGILLFNVAGTVEADLNADIVWDASINAWRVIFARWSQGLNNGVQLYSGTYTGDVLNGVHVITGTLLNVTQRVNNAVYDECLVWDGANTRWLLSYAVSPGGSFGGNMRIALDTSPDLVTWTNLWVDNTNTGYEGSATALIGGNWYVFGGNGANYRVWNVSGASLGTLTVDVFPPAAGNPPPHFIPFAWLSADITEYYALSWNNVQQQLNGVPVGIFATGVPMLFKAAQTESGFEFPVVTGVT